VGRAFKTPTRPDDNVISLEHAEAERYRKSALPKAAKVEAEAKGESCCRRPGPLTAPCSASELR
jgi:hypothetical protein